MAFGFVVVKFSLFVKQVSLLLEKEQDIPKPQGYSVIIGIVLVAVGAITTVLSYFRYRITQKQLQKDSYFSSSLLLTVITSFIFLVSILLIFYLIKST
jgi:putative membrane protein